MKKYEVVISRTYVHTATIIIEAKDKQEAEQKALEEIGDHDMSINCGLTDDDEATVLREI